MKPSEIFTQKQLQRQQYGFHQKNIIKQQKQPENQQNFSIKYTKIGSLKDKKIIKKAYNFFQKCIQRSLIKPHVYNVMNIFAINQLALTEKNFDESLLMSWFYIKSIEKVQLRKNALIMHVKNIESTPPQYEQVIESFKSYGNSLFYDLALAIESSIEKFRAIDFNKKMNQTFDCKPLSRYIDASATQSYICKVGTNRLVISAKFLELIGENQEDYALSLCKFKTPIREILSNENYGILLKKSIQNLGHLCDFLNKKITQEELQALTFLEFRDYVLAKNHTRIYCKITLSMPTPLITLFRIEKVIENGKSKNMMIISNKEINTLMEQIKQKSVFKDSHQLKDLLTIPANYFQENKMKTSKYQQIKSQMFDQLQ